MHFTSPVLTAGLALGAARVAASDIPPPPLPEPIDVIEIPLPPVAPSTEQGACTPLLNPRGTGCIRKDRDKFQAGDFTPDGNHVVVNVDFVGAPASPDPASIYAGEQLILVKVDGTTFANGDSWKCLTCAVPPENALGLDPRTDYPHAFRSGTKALWGHNIIDCGSVPLDKCDPENTHIYPIHWPTTADGSGPGGLARELRLHPDDVHMGFNAFTDVGGQNTFLARLEFNPDPATGEPQVPRYDLVDVNLLLQLNGKPPIEVVGDELQVHRDAITVGELRGFSGSGDEIIYIGMPWESTNIDLMAVHVTTGAIRRLTSHPEYVDPAAVSHDDEWVIAMDTRGSDRQMWMSGMRWIPPMIDILAVSAAASTRNNGPRRFFQPILIDKYGDRGDYFGQQVNAAGDGSDGSVNDPNWNGLADPAFSPDSTRIVYYQGLVVAPSCGGDNPLPCPESTAQGGREYRLMVANLTSRQPKAPAPVYPVPDAIPWATPFPPGASAPQQFVFQPGEFTLAGRVSGSASVNFTEDASIPGAIGSVSVAYSDFCDEEGYVINGAEEFSRELDLSNPWNQVVHWFSDLTQTGSVEATKKTGPGGFHLQIDVMTNIFNASGTLTTTIDDVVYKQPANGT
ncbi:unnamed protein product [Parascedosporium putredinis]|uniref:Saponin hydrolase n=1 Tax=Parascedosporium putredinis TaxID=1442378 RepID=A0A9P1MC90_9PEZI|nr:unnamed protein product [Parascedosporium putredinis]CAI8000176.1 unnamed protein product [Parascedosporium putredinis]